MVPLYLTPPESAGIGSSGTTSLRTRRSRASPARTSGFTTTADQLWTDILLLASPSLRAFYGDPLEDEAKSMDLHSKIEIQSTLTVVV